ncbi:hypothetical protein [Flagellimonas pelagia]|uniref:hypothetical protein n=1 Tax=Flagellimonas pelagia TaxID=2306998 RepID=UPI001604BC9B|nr:hypothetical protein [Allomuricauda maritima]
MKSKVLPVTLIILSGILVVLNFILESEDMDFGFWMRISSSVLLILAMIITIRAQKQRQ